MHTNKMTRSLRVASFFALASLAMGAAPSAHAQSCILCYTSVAGGGPAVVRALQSGILALLIPALLLFSGVFFLIYRRACAANEEQEQHPAARRVVRPAAQAVLRPAVNKAALPIRGTFPTTAS